MFLGCFMNINNWVLSILVIISVQGKIYGNLGGLKLKIREEKSEILSDNPGASRMPEPLKAGSV